MRKKTVKINPHKALHKEVDRKLDYILNKVSANGNPGLDNSLKDLYQGQKNIEKKLDSIFALIKPDMDRANFWKAAKEVYKSSPFFKFHSTKFGMFILIVAILLITNALIHPFEGVVGVFMLLAQFVNKFFGGA
jgi:hypothetical protein